MIQTNELSNIGIEKIIKNFNLLNVFGGVYSKDRLPELKKGKFYIINMQKIHRWWWDTLGFIIL